MLGVNVLGRVVSGAGFPASSSRYLHLAVGHLNFLPAAYLPWILAVLILAMEHRLMFLVAIGGLVCALTFTEGNYTFLYAGILVALGSLWLSILHRSIGALLAGIAIGLFRGPLPRSR